MQTWDILQQGGGNAAVISSDSGHSIEKIENLPFASSTMGAIGYRVSSKSNVNNPSCFTLDLVVVSVSSSLAISACSSVVVGTRNNRFGTKASVEATRHSSTRSVVFIIIYSSLYVVVVGGGYERGTGRRDRICDAKSIWESMSFPVWVWINQARGCQKRKNCVANRCGLLLVPKDRENGYQILCLTVMIYFCITN